MRKTFASLFLACALLLPSAVHAEEGAMTAFKQSHQEVISMVDAKAESEALQTRVDKLLDYDWLSHAALGGKSRYAERCATRCDEFKALLTKLVRRNYLKRIKAKDRGAIEYLGEEVRKRATKVNTRVNYTDPDGKAQTIEIDYVMHKVGDTWQVRDIITSGASLAKNYKYELSKLHKEGGIDLVIERLKAKLAELDKADAAG